MNCFSTRSPKDQLVSQVAYYLVNRYLPLGAKSVNLVFTIHGTVVNNHFNKLHYFTSNFALPLFVESQSLSNIYFELKFQLTTALEYSPDLPAACLQHFYHLKNFQRSVYHFGKIHVRRSIHKSFLPNQQIVPVQTIQILIIIFIIIIIIIIIVIINSLLFVYKFTKYKQLQHFRQANIKSRTYEIENF